MRSERLPALLAFPQVEITVYHPEGPMEAEELYEDLLDALFDAERAQQTALHRITETEGPTQIKSKIPDTYAVRGALRVSLRG
ncbi:hypothetical protein JNN96_29225 [Mycobacterium sp. DSM 3803]|nr:hypothetical protein [Mycobacterium sp. DSM 3803]